MAFLLDDPTTSIGGSLSGRVGSTIYARGRYAPFSYTYVPHVDADSQKQINMRSAFAWAAQEWKYESLANREAWASYAKNVSSINRVGERYWPSSFNRYVAAVTIRQWNGQFWPFPAPTIFVLAYHGSCDYGDWRDYYDRSALIRKMSGDFRPRAGFGSHSLRRNHYPLTAIMDRTPTSPVTLAIL